MKYIVLYERGTLQMTNAGGKVMPLEQFNSPMVP